MGFGVLITIAIVVVLLKFGRRKRSGSVPSAPESKRGRVRAALKAVQSRRMTFAEASAFYRVSEKEIKALRYHNELFW
jgi:hypothetical protein